MVSPPAIGRRPLLCATLKMPFWPGGWFVMEFGYGQEEDVRRLVAARPMLRLDRIRDDLQGIARTAVIQQSLNSQ